MIINNNTIDYFWSHVEITPSCWNWLGSKNQDGYGRFWFGRRYIPAHRFVYELLESNIIKTLELDHLCKNRRCVNPTHLDIVTHKENCLRGRYPNKEKTHCKNGHEFNEENTRISKDGHDRACRLCHRTYGRNWRLKHPQFVKTSELKK